MEVGGLRGRVDGVGGLPDLDLDLPHSFKSLLQVPWGEVGELFALSEEHRPLWACDKRLSLLGCPDHDGVETLDVFGHRHFATATSKEQQRDTQHQRNESGDSHRRPVKQCPP